MGRPSGSDEVFKGLEASRQMLAVERDRAIEALNGMRAKVTLLLQQNGQMQQDMARWVTAILLTTGQHEVAIDQATLSKASEWVLQRAPTAKKTSTVWRVLPREEFERQKAEAEAAAAKPKIEIVE